MCIRMALTELARFPGPRGTHHNRYLRSGMRPHHRDDDQQQQHHHDDSVACNPRNNRLNPTSCPTRPGTILSRWIISASAVVPQQLLELARRPARDQACFAAAVVRQAARELDTGQTAQPRSRRRGGTRPALPSHRSAAGSCLRRAPCALRRRRRSPRRRN